MKRYDLSYTFDNSLREVPSNREDMKAYLSEEIEGLEVTSSVEKYVETLGKLVVISRILGDMDQARDMGISVIDIINERNLDVHLWIINTLRLGHVFQWREEHMIAFSSYNNVLEVCYQELPSEVDKYRHLAVQHIGKFYFDLGLYRVARESFEYALEDREKIGDQDLIESSKFAIKISRERELANKNIVHLPSSPFHREKEFINPRKFIKEVIERRDRKALKGMNLRMRLVDASTLGDNNPLNPQ